MIRLLLLTCVSLSIAVLIAGCTDFVEPNQLAFVIGTGVDQTEDGSIEISHQIVIPSQQNNPTKGGSGSSDSFFVISAQGKDVFDASQKIQLKMSRKLLTSHRALIAINESYFNDNDVSELFDKLGRDPANNLRDNTIMVKGASARDFLMLKHPLEHLSSIAASKELQINGLNSFTTRELIVDSLADGTRPLMPVVQIEHVRMSSKKNEPNAVLAGFAVLNRKLQTKGILDIVEGSNAVWMTGKGTYSGVTIRGKDGNGYLSFRLTHLNRRISSAASNDPGRVVLTVKAQAYLLENTTSIDMSDIENRIEVQQYLNEQIGKELQLTMEKVQHYGPDVFGIGEFLHRHYPYWWKSRRNDWDEQFRTIDVVVKSNVQFKSIGVSGGQLK